MGKLLNIITPLHKKTKRNYIERMINEKVNCMKISRKYDQEFWDGNRKFGYGGYKYDGRWKVVAERLIQEYNLKSDAKILDVGCGKGFLLYEFKRLLPEAHLRGFDFSQYALDNAKEEIRGNLFFHNAKEKYPYKDKEFDLVLSLTTLYNLEIDGFKNAIQEVERVGKNKYVTLESYNNEKELFNLQCWALTCELFFKPKEWKWLFEEFGYKGDYEFIYFK